MGPNTAGYFLDRVRPPARGTLQPAIEEDARPVVRLVLLQPLEALFEQVGRVPLLLSCVHKQAAIAFRTAPEQWHTHQG